MSRPPTQAEMRETNPNMKQTCDKCHLVVYGDKNYGTFENMLTISLSGGYAEYVDSVVLTEDELEFHLCHKCAHQLMKTFFGNWELSGWHERTKDKYCDGWKINWDEHDSVMKAMFG